MFKCKDILAIILGAGIFSFGIYLLVIPFHFYEGGATGITLITYYLFKIPVIPHELGRSIFPSLSWLETAGLRNPSI
ncbi:MAG: YitT family protein [Streptococcus sp.]